VSETSVDTTSHGLSMFIETTLTATDARSVIIVYMETVGMTTLSTLISLSKQC